MSGSNQLLEVRSPLLFTIALRSLESLIENNSTAILQVCISLLLLPQWFWSLQDLPCKEQCTKLVMTVVETEEMVEVVAEGVSSVQIWKYLHLSPTHKSHRLMTIILVPRGTTCLGASVWGSMVVSVNILLTKATVLPTFLGDSCL